MPRYTVSWKDPDRYCGELDDYIYKVPKEEYDKLHKLGMDEYLTVIFDTDNMTAMVYNRYSKNGVKSDV